MFKSRLKSKSQSLFRRRTSSGPKDSQPQHPFQDPTPSQPSSPASIKNSATVPNSPATGRKPRQSRSFSSLRERRRKAAEASKSKEKLPPPPTPNDPDIVEAALEREENGRKEQELEQEKSREKDASVISGGDSSRSASVPGTLLTSSVVSLPATVREAAEAPSVVVQEATPGSPPLVSSIDARVDRAVPRRGDSRRFDTQTLALERARAQSLESTADVDVIEVSLHEKHLETVSLLPAPSISRGYSGTTALNASMLNRKVWVKRPNAAATIVVIKEDDFVDEAKEVILAKYRNQLQRHFDAPDLTIRITTRGQPAERVLGPDETLCRAIDSHYPGGQTIEEALIVDVPPRRTPRASPRAHHEHRSHYDRGAHTYYDEGSARPHESATDYFPPMPPMNLGQPSPLLTNTSHDSHSHDSRKSHAAHERAMSVLNTGQVIPLPSPGALGRRAHQIKQHARPSHPRTQTSSPTTLTSSVSSRQVNVSRPRLDSTASTERHPQLAVSTTALPTPPVPDLSKSVASVTAPQNSTANPPTPRLSSPRPGNRAKRTRQKQKDEGPTTATSLLPPGVLDTSVPPINVLIVEDNMINMRLLEQFVRRLGVRWQTAVNGREAVNKWRQGGFHLVLMDIQLPIMSGLEATKEIRRLERVNNIGVFSSVSDTSPELDSGEDGEAGEEKKKGVKDEDKLFEEGYSRLFKSPVIIVALTASNLQSDRHEALAAGCNDFLTKVCFHPPSSSQSKHDTNEDKTQPVNFVWFERKVKEWGCMQALIDFDGWRKWKDFAEANGLKDPTKPAGAAARQPAKKVLKAEPKKVEEKKEAMIPDPKSLNSTGLERVGSPDTKDFASLGKEESRETVIHAPETEGKKEEAVGAS